MFRKKIWSSDFLFTPFQAKINLFNAAHLIQVCWLMQCTPPAKLISQYFHKTYTLHTYNCAPKSTRCIMSCATITGGTGRQFYWNCSKPASPSDKTLQWTGQCQDNVSEAGKTILWNHIRGILESYKNSTKNF